jgi:hypothetical protein
VLLVDHDQPEPLDRREDRRARPDRDPRLARAQPPPLVVALALAERGVQQRDRVPEARLEAPDVCGVSAISGTSTITPCPRSSARAAARR